MPNLSLFLTLWILMAFARSSNEDISVNKVRAKHDKRSKNLKFKI